MSVSIIETLINSDFSDFQSRVVRYSSWEDYRNVILGKVEEDTSITKSTLVGGIALLSFNHIQLKEVKIDDNKIKHMEIVFKDTRSGRNVILTSYLVENMNLDFVRP